MRPEGFGAGGGRPRDVRRRGFADRVALEEAIRWIDAQASARSSEDRDPADAAGCRRLAEDVAVQDALPAEDHAGENGYALRAADTMGASPYNPLVLRLGDASCPFRPGAAVPVVTGDRLPSGADAVLAYDGAEADGSILEVFGEVAPGRGVVAKGQAVAARSSLLASGRPLRPQDLGLLAALGLSTVRLIRQPRVALVVAGPKSSGRAPARDACGPMLRHLVSRDGGTSGGEVRAASTLGALRHALLAANADAVLVVGRTGTGADDVVPLALADAGDLAIHGIALRPGGSVGLGRVGETPAILLPGDPLACLCAYELLAGRLIRRLGGGDADLPHPWRDMKVERKIVSAIGTVDVVQVRFGGAGVMPLGSDTGLASAVRADGFVVVPAPFEGYGPGTRVRVNLYDVGRRGGVGAGEDR